MHSSPHLKPNHRETCPDCLLPRLPQGANMARTSMLFASLHCMCDQEKGLDRGYGYDRVKARSRSTGDEHPRCPQCHKRIVEQRVGSLTSFLFQSTRCTCKRSGAMRSNPMATRILSKTNTKTKVHRPHNLKQRFERLQSGDIIGGSYELVRPIGEGGMGMVFQARHATLKRPCALKFLLPDMINEKSWQLFKNEARILNSLNNPGICQIFDFGLHEDALPFLAMEYLEGMTLEDLINRQGSLNLGSALQIFGAVASTLAYAHRNGIVHRDIKPANIMLTVGPNDKVNVKLLDFGIAEAYKSSESKSIRARSVDVSEPVIGSAFYMSPEQFRGEPPTESTDIYSLGCSLYESLVGKPPFVAQTIDALSEMHQTDLPDFQILLNNDFDPSIVAILHKSLAKNTDRRYQNVSQMAIDISNLAEHKPLQFAAAEEEQVKSDLERQRGEETGQTSNKSKILVLLAVSLSLTAVASLMVANGKFAFQRRPAKAIESRLAHEVAQSTYPQEYIGFLKTGTAIGKKDFRKDREYWTFDFPYASTLGNFQVRSPAQTGKEEPEEEQYAQPLQGRFDIDVKNMVFLEPNNRFGFYPALLARFNPDLINEISIDNSIEILPDPMAVSHWTRLTGLEFRFCTIPDGYVQKLAQLKNLHVLILDECHFNVDELISTDLVDRLLDLNVSGMEAGQGRLKLLKRLSRSTNLRTLHLSAPFTKQEVDLVESYTWLKQFIIDGHSLDRESYDRFAAMKNLDVLNIWTFPEFATPDFLARLNKSKDGHPYIIFKAQAAKVKQSNEMSEKILDAFQ